MYEIALAEWGVTPEYVNEYWTEELLALMFIKRRDRFQQYGKQQNETPKLRRTKLGLKEFARVHRGIKVHTVKTKV